MRNIFYLSPHGNDKNDGSKKKPWATLAGARDALREIRKNGDLKGVATVMIAPGVYHFNELVEFRPEDGNTKYIACESPEDTIFDAGEELEGFREEKIDGRRTWILDIPDVASCRRYFRSLFVDGKRRPRARLPKFSPDSEGVKNLFRIGELRFPEKRKLFDGDNVFKPAKGDFQDWKSLSDAEIVVLHYWIETRLGTPHYDPKTGWVTCSRRSVFNLYESFNLKHARYYIDNLKEALTEPGEWYLDRSEGRLYYLPMPSEKLGKTKIVAGRSSFFIRVCGNAFNHGQEVSDQMGAVPVENLTFEGITFRNSDWYSPTAEFLTHDRVRAEGVPLGSSPQGAVHVPSAIEFRWARNCHIKNCCMENIGLSGISIWNGCRDCSVTNSTLQDIGGGGILVGGSELDGPVADRTGFITISDNKITDIGKIFQQGIGIILTHAFNCKVVHNEVARTCYTGISCGWSWGYRETISRNNLIENNLIHDIGQAVLSDMGGIYLLGVQPGTIVRGNHIYNINSADYGGWGIYPDEGSSHILIEGNWVHDIQGSPLRIHFSRELVVRDNVFARSKEEGLIGIGKVEEHVAANIFANILIGPAVGVFEGGYSGDVAKAFRSDANLIWFPGGKINLACNYPEYRKDVKRLSWKEWLAIGNDCLSIIADPLMKETENDIIFLKNSPAHKIGFRIRSWSKCGPRKKL